MPQPVPPSSDQLSTPPVLADQSNSDQSSLAPSVEGEISSAEEQPGETHTAHNNSNAFASHSTDLYRRLFTQYQQDFASVKKSLSFGRQFMPKVATIASWPSPPPPYLSATLEASSSSLARASLAIIPSAFDTTLLSSTKQIGHQMQSLLQPMHTMMAESLHGLATELSSTVGSVVVEAVRFNSITESFAQSFRSIMPSWNAFSLASTFPVLNAMKQFPPITSFFPDMSWMKVLTDHINTTLIVFPDWLPSIRGWKERLKQHLLAAFRLIGFCFAPSMSEELMYQIANQFEAGKKESSITLLIWNYYYRNNHTRLKQAVERWQDNSVYAQLWRQYLLPAFQAHVRGEYGMSTSALAPRVEGISSHVVKKNMILPATQPREGLLGLGSPKSVILRALKTAGDETNLESDTTNVAHWVRVKSAVAYIEDTFCKKLDFEGDYDFIHLGNRQVNRRGQLHGIQINAGTALNSLRLFLLLDTMYGLLQNYIARGGII